MTMNGAPSRLRDYFEDKLKEHGPTARGVDWNSERRQEICFRQLVRIMENPHGIEQDTSPTILDYGCGYGALAGWLAKSEIAFSRYQGFDFIPSMIEQARHLFGALEKVEFSNDDAEVKPADFVIASGLLGLKLNPQDVDAAGNGKGESCVRDEDERQCTCGGNRIKKQSKLVREGV